MTEFIIMYGICSFLFGIATTLLYGNSSIFSKEGLGSILTGASGILFFTMIHDFLVSIFGVKKSLEIIHRILAHLAVFLFYIAIITIKLSILFMLANLFGIILPTEIICIIGIALSLAFSIIGILQSYSLKSTYYKIPKRGDEKNIRLALTSDHHFGVINQTILAKRLIAKLKSEKPDIIIIAGDLFDGPVFNIKTIIPYLKSMTEIAPCIYTPGNHEELGNFDEFLEIAEQTGIIILVNNFTTIQGITFGGYDYRTEDLPNFQSIVNRDCSRIQNSYMLLHKPSYYKLKVLSDCGARFIFSGHTHNGQMFPINIPVKMVYGKYVYGKNTINTTTTFTSSGVGTTRIPVRLFNTPEIMIIDVV